MGSVFCWSHLLIMPENFDKIAGIGKAAAVGDLGNALIGIGKLFTGNLDAVIIQIVHWRAVGEFLGFRFAQRARISSVRFSL